MRDPAHTVMPGCNALTVAIRYVLNRPDVEFLPADVQRTTSSLP
jgi:hypothetical protein